jgi:hypothetical protein
LVLDVGLKTEWVERWGQNMNCSLCRGNKSTTYMLLKLPRDKKMEAEISGQKVAINE